VTKPSSDPASDSPIEAFLDELVVGMSTRRPRRLRHLVQETEAHLRDDADRAAAAGLSQYQAESEAVTRFGSAADLVQQEDRLRVTPRAVLARQFVSTGLLLGGIGAVAIGVSGVIAAVIGRIAGAAKVVDVRPGQVLSAADCARWLAGDPGAVSCHDAAVADWVDEVVGYRLLLGMFGVAALVALLLLRRRWLPRGRWVMLPAMAGDTIAVTFFAIGGLWALLLGVDAVVVNSGNGSGQWFSAAPVALAALAVFSVRLIHDLRVPGAEPPQGAPLPAQS